DAGGRHFWCWMGIGLLSGMPDLGGSGGSTRSRGSTEIPCIPDIPAIPAIPANRSSPLSRAGTRAGIMRPHTCAQAPVRTGAHAPTRPPARGGATDKRGGFAGITGITGITGTAAHPPPAPRRAAGDPPDPGVDVDTAAHGEG